MTLNSYIYELGLEVRRNANWLFAAGDAISWILYVNPGTARRAWGKNYAYDEGLRPTNDGTDYFFFSGINFGTPIFVPANATVSVVLINSTLLAVTGFADVFYYLDD